MWVNNSGLDWLFRFYGHQVNMCSPGCEAPGRQALSMCVKIEAGNPRALIYEACQYPDCNNTLAQTRLLVLQVDNKHSLAGRLTLYELHKAIISAVKWEKTNTYRSLCMISEKKSLGERGKNGHIYSQIISCKRSLWLLTSHNCLWTCLLNSVLIWQIICRRTF